MAQLDVCPTGDQVAGSTPAGSAIFFCGDWSWNIFFYAPAFEEWWKGQIVLPLSVRPSLSTPGISSLRLFFRWGHPLNTFLVVFFLVLSQLQWLSWMRIWRVIRRLGVQPPPGWQHSFMAVDHQIFSTVIPSLPLIKEVGCQFLAKECTQYWITAKSTKPAQLKSG